MTADEVEVAVRPPVVSMTPPQVRVLAHLRDALAGVSILPGSVTYVEPGVIDRWLDCEPAAEIDWLGINREFS